MFKWFTNREKKLKKWPKGVPEISVDEIHMSKERGLQMEMSHPLFAKLTSDLCSLFEESGAENYVEYQVYSEKFGMMSVTIQKVSGETPAMKNERLKNKIAMLEATIQTLMERVCEKEVHPSQTGNEVY